tara:strand:- start:743 stop:2056 length:1314 start_codon:yes stop_codon:yes gene_type:complete
VQQRAAQMRREKRRQAETEPVPELQPGDETVSAQPLDSDFDDEMPSTKPYGGKVLSAQQPGAGITIGDFSPEVIDEVLARYTKKEDITLGPELGRGAYGIVYEVDGPSGLPEALKITVESKEYNAYKKIEKLKDAIESADENVATALPTIYDITQIVSVPVDRTSRNEVPPLTFIPYPASSGGETYRFYLIRMELLKPVPPGIRADVFAPSPDPFASGALSQEARKRFVDTYLSLDNLTGSLESVMKETRWERLLSYLRVSPSGRGRGVWADMERLMGDLKKAYLESDPENHVFAMHDINQALSKGLEKTLARYIDDEEFLEDIQMYLYLFLHKQLRANVRLPQYDPEAIEAMPGLRAQIVPPGKIQSQVAKNFYNRLQGLEQYNVQYGDVHANNLMMREDGDLVVADVGLFLFGPEGSRKFASSIVERYRRLAGLI